MAKVDVQDHPEDTKVASAEANQVDDNSSKSKLGVRTIFEIVVVILLIAVAVWAGILYHKKQDLQDQLAKINANPQLAVQHQTTELLNKVGQLISLPSKETPTIATVSDAVKAKKQSAFFAKAQDGDKVLMYVKAGQAILYRPSTNKIVLVAPLTFSNTKSDSSNKAVENAGTKPAGETVQ